MNEQIKELARKAGISILYEYDGYDGHAGVANFDDIEKFAGLIVKQCAEIALQSGNITNKSAQAKIEAQRIYHKIQDQFGD
jgi:hypothetical protein